MTTYIHKDMTVLFQHPLNPSRKYNDCFVRMFQQTTVPVETVAFHAYFSTHNPASTHHHILAFDTVERLPSSLSLGPGLICLHGLLDYSVKKFPTSKLLVNNKVVNTILFNPVSEIEGSVTGTAVVLFNQGDDVSVRTGTSYNYGYIMSDTIGWLSFAGGILM